MRAVTIKDPVIRSSGSSQAEVERFPPFGCHTGSGRSHQPPAEDKVMRFKSLGLSVAALLTLAVAPGAEAQQIVVRDPCFYLRENCHRRDELEQRGRERAAERAAEAEERRWRLNEARQARGL